MLIYVAGHFNEEFSKRVDPTSSLISRPPDVGKTSEDDLVKFSCSTGRMDSNLLVIFWSIATRTSKLYLAASVWNVPLPAWPAH